jgi:hypothetical protein
MTAGNSNVKAIIKFRFYPVEGVSFPGSPGDNFCSIKATYFLWKSIDDVGHQEHALGRERC